MKGLQLLLSEKSWQVWKSDVLKPNDVSEPRVNVESENRINNRPLTAWLSRF